MRVVALPPEEIDRLFGDTVTETLGSVLISLVGDQASVLEDVLALGRILYATLVSRWPGGSQYGLPAAPISANGSWQTPAQVRAGVSPALDRIADRILNPQPQGGEPLRTASRIESALSLSIAAMRSLLRSPRHSPWGTVTPSSGATSCTNTSRQ